jgi:hypothetical protein
LSRARQELCPHALGILILSLVLSPTLLLAAKTGAGMPSCLSFLRSLHKVLPEVTIKTKLRSLKIQSQEVIRKYVSKRKEISENSIHSIG